jgi:hypothetical protein
MSVFGEPNDWKTDEPPLVLPNLLPDAELTSRVLLVNTEFVIAVEMVPSCKATTNLCFEHVSLTRARGMQLHARNQSATNVVAIAAR